MSTETQSTQPAEPHAEIKAAFAAGVPIQSEITDGYGNHIEWTDPHDPQWYPHIRYRIKPAQPAAESPWRPLEPEEIIQEGDEYMGDIEKNPIFGPADWRPVEIANGLNRVAGSRSVDTLIFRTRRPLPSAQPAAEQAGSVECEYCGGEGVVDSGGVTPWGEGINVPCGACKPTEPSPAPQQTALEWVKENRWAEPTLPGVDPEYNLNGDKALELADRCDRAEAEAKAADIRAERLRGQCAGFQAQVRTYMNKTKKLALVVADARAERDTLRAALEQIIKHQPCLDGGGCFYPVHDGDGEYIGEQNADPISVIACMVGTAQEALNQTNK